MPHHALLVNDFLLLGPPGLNVCQTNLNTTVKCCKALGVPLALVKKKDPSTSLFFLGIVINTIHMQLCLELPQDKLQRIKNSITAWLCKKSATKRETLSIVG